MQIELSILNGEGYISTFSDNNVSIYCKPVHASEIQSLVQDLSKNKTLNVQENSDKTYWVVRECSQVKETTVVETTNEQVMKSYNNSGKLHYQDKANMEFSRYKQDCRKKALEIAFEEVKLVGGFTDTVVKETADKYYQWLIDIS